MAKHIVKCVYCEKPFDTNEVPFKKIGRRYAHENCEIDPTKEALYDYIFKLFNVKTMPVKIGKEIRRYTTELGYTYGGILGTLVYIYEVEKNDIEKANGGIAFVEYKYQEAKKYWNSINSARASNIGKDIKIRLQDRVISISQPVKKKPLIKEFDLGGGEFEK